MDISMPTWAEEKKARTGPHRYPNKSCPLYERPHRLKRTFDLKQQELQRKNREVSDQKVDKVLTSAVKGLIAWRFEVAMQSAHRPGNLRNLALGARTKVRNFLYNGTQSIVLKSTQRFIARESGYAFLGPLASPYLGISETENLDSDPPRRFFKASISQR